MPEEVVIRRAEKSEMGFIRKLSVEELPAEPNERELGQLDRAKAVFGNRLDALFSREGNEFYVAELTEGGGFAGYVWFGVSERPFSGVKIGWIYDIMVLPEHRGKGVGEALLKHALEVSRERGFDEIGLMVNAKNRVASSLYDKLGFRTEYMIMGRSEKEAVSNSNT